MPSDEPFVDPLNVARDFSGICRVLAFYGELTGVEWAVLSIILDAAHAHGWPVSTRAREIATRTKARDHAVHLALSALSGDAGVLLKINGKRTPVTGHGILRREPGPVHGEHWYWPRTVREWAWREGVDLGTVARARRGWPRAWSWGAERVARRLQEVVVRRDGPAKVPVPHPLSFEWRRWGEAIEQLFVRGYSASLMLQVLRELEHDPLMSDVRGRYAAERFVEGFTELVAALRSPLRRASYALGEVCGFADTEGG